MPKLDFSELGDIFNQHYTNLIDRVNDLLGHNGVIELANHISMNGNRIQNVGDPVLETDAVPTSFANKNYSAAALNPKMKPGGPNQFPGYRQMNNATQRESVSSWLNDLMSTPPSANGIIPTLTNVGGGVQVNIPSSTLKFADGTIQQLQSFTDNVPFATSFTISTITASGGIVTVVLTAPSGLVGGGYITLDGVTPDAFNGNFQILNSSGGGATLTYENPAAGGSGSGGTVSTGNIVYYAARKRDTSIFRLGSFTADTAQQRLKINNDGFQIVAVVSINSSGASQSQSGGGGTPLIGTPTAGAFF